MITTENESIHALAIEAEATVTLAKDFYQCIVKDLRGRSGAHHRAVRPRPPSEEEVQRVMSGFPPPNGKSNGKSNGKGSNGQ